MTIFTGVNPGKHNIFGFVSFENPNRISVSDSTTIKTKAIWDYLGASGLRVGMVNIPMTYPPMKVNGFVVGGMGTPTRKAVFTYPPCLGAELTSRGYVVDVDVRLFTIGEDDYIRKLWWATEKRTEIFLDIIKRNDWDFLMTVYTAVDRVQHVNWHKQQHQDGILNKLARTEPLS